MASYNTPIITTQGQSLLKAAIANDNTMTFTKIVFSSDDYSQSTDSNVASLTALSSLDLTATARAFVDVNGNLKIRGVATNQNTTSAFYIKTYGLYVKNSAGTEMLFAVATTQNANFVPAYNNKQTNQVAYTFNLAISSTSNITLSNQSDVDVTQADIASINNAVNSNASSLNATQSSFASSMSSAFSANSSNNSNFVSSATTSLTSYVSSNVSSMQSQVGSNATNISNNSSAISSNATNIASNASAISSNANSTSSAISSVSSSNNAVSSSIASTVSVNQSNIANNSSAISSLQSSASSAIGSNATNISTNSSAISSMQATLQQNANNLVNAIKTTVSSQFMPEGTDFNTVTQSGMYAIQSGYQSYPNAYFPGTDGILVVFNDGASEILQQVTTLDGLGGVRINYRIQGIGGTWTRWIALATVDDLSSTALNFKGIAPGNTLSSLTASGIYDLNGKSYTDWLDPTNLWGQLIVINTGGVCNQRFQNNVSNSWIRTINPWGITPWRRLDQ